MNVSHQNIIPQIQLPLLVQCDKDKNFLKEVYKNIYTDSSGTSDDSPDSIYMVYKSAFDNVVDYVEAYKPILTSIKAEYENVIETVKRGHREANFLQRQIQVLACQPSTLENYHKRIAELKQRISDIESESNKIEKEIDNYRLEISTRHQKLQEQATLSVKSNQKVVRRDPRPLPCFSAAQMVNKELLIAEVRRLDQILRTLQRSEKIKFAPKEDKDRLNNSLVSKLNQIDKLNEIINFNQRRKGPLLRAVQAARAFTANSAPGQNFYGSLGEAVLRAFRHKGKNEHMFGLTNIPVSQTVTSSTSETKDEILEEYPGLGRESTHVLNYLEHFKDLMEYGRFDRAAQYAANSPRGLLRTIDIFNKFKDADSKYPSQLILLNFCEALVSTAPAIDITLPVNLSFEVVQCALHHGRVDLIEHWITNNRLTISETIGDLLEAHSATHSYRSITCLDLAQFTYEEALSRQLVQGKSTQGPAAHNRSLINKSVQCLIRSDRLRAAMNQAREAKFKKNDYLQLISSYPSVDLVLVILDTLGLNEGWCPVVDKLVELEYLDILACILPTWIETCVAKSGQNRSEVICSLLTYTKHLDAQFWITVLPFCPPSMTYHKEFLTEAIVQDVMKKGILQANPL